MIGARVFTDPKSLEDLIVASLDCFGGSGVCLILWIVGALRGSTNAILKFKTKGNPNIHNTPLRCAATSSDPWIQMFNQFK